MMIYYSFDYIYVSQRTAEAVNISKYLCFTVRLHVSHVNLMNSWTPSCAYIAHTRIPESVSVVAWNVNFSS